MDVREALIPIVGMYSRRSNQSLADESHPFEVGKEGDGTPPSMRPVNKQRFTYQVFAFDIVMIFPRTRIATCGAVVAQRKKLVVEQSERVKGIPLP